MKSEEFKYIKPYKINGKWECINVHDSVHILVDDITNKQLLFVKQYRPAIADYTIECCAGLVDKDLSIVNIAREEMQEELGYRPINIIRLGKSYPTVGISSSISHFYYAKVSTTSFIGKQPGIDENIETIRVGYRDIPEFMHKLSTTSSIYLVQQWLLNNKG